jgi:hypothetical protein
MRDYSLDREKPYQWLTPASWNGRPLTVKSVKKVRATVDWRAEAQQSAVDLRAAQRNYQATVSRAHAAIENLRRADAATTEMARANAGRG